MAAQVMAARKIFSEREVWMPKLVPLLALALLVAAFSGMPGFLSERNLESILRTLPVLLVVALGATLPILMGSIDLSLAGIIVIAAGTGSVLIADHGEKALLLAPLIGLVAGVLNGVIVAVGKLPSFLVTLGTLFVFNGLALIIMGGVPHPYVGSVSKKVGNGTAIIGGFELSFLSLIAGVILVVIWLYVSRTRYGRYTMAVGGGEHVAKLSGVNVTRVKIATFALAGLLAGIAGLFLTVRSQAATPSMGEPYLLNSIAAVVIGGTSLSGGVGGPKWTLLGALIIVILDNGMTLAGLDPNIQTSIRGAVIVVASALTIRRLGTVVK